MLPSCRHACALLFAAAIALPMTGAATPTRYTVTAIPGLNPAPFTGTSAMRINGAGQVAGNVTTLDAKTYFIWDGGSTRLVPGITADSNVEMGLNARGEFVGNSMESGGSVRPFVYRNGSVEYLGSPSGEPLSATAINDKGQAAIVGYASQTRTGIAENGQIGWLPVPAFATSMIAEAINNRGQLAGGYGTENSGSHAFTTRFGQLVDLGLPGYYSVGSDINDQGEVVGTTLDPDAGRFLPYLYRDGGITMLPWLGFGGEVYAINNLGTMVGLSGAYEGALWEDGELYLMSQLVDGPAWDYLEVRDINDAGQIAGTACRDERCMAVIFNPVSAVPEAPHWAMLGAGLLPLWLFRRRRASASGADRRPTS